MKLTRLLFTLLSALLAMNCAEQNVVRTDQALQPAAKKKIPEQDDNAYKGYITLGAIEYTLTSDSSSDKAADQKQKAIDALKNAALEKYGDDVGAIIETVIEEHKENGNKGIANVVHVKGVAIAFFTNEHKPIVTQTRHSEHNATTVSHKSRSVKPKPYKVKVFYAKKTKPKIQEEDIEISPSEMLK
ncbi:MAG: hypothetical protein ABL933_08035 [Methyloglobulus sp.]|nr:hypothetical protein [Methyloglobulus sp.]